MGEQRPVDMPNVPTLRELPGLSHFQVASWNALAAPAKTPRAVIARLNAELAEILREPETVQRLASFHVQAKSSSPAQLSVWLEREMVRWREVIERAGLAAS
jgi:tripartite-type tricarboxylate transporter receptor subunit TctC